LHFVCYIILIYDSAILACKYTYFSSHTEIYQGNSFFFQSFPTIFSQQSTGKWSLASISLSILQL